MNVLVAGIGHRDRGDDAVGPLVADAVAERLGAYREHSDGGSGVEVLAGTDPATMLARLDRVESLVVIDAVRTGAPPGSVFVRDLADRPLPASGFAPGAPGSSHLLGLAEAIELARVLGRLPASALLVAIEAASFELGSGLGDAVSDAVPLAAQKVLALIGALESRRSSA